MNKNVTFTEKLLSAPNADMVVKLVGDELECIYDNYPCDSEEYFKVFRTDAMKKLWERIIESPWHANSLMEGLTMAHKVFEAFFCDHRDDTDALYREYPDFDEVYEELSQELQDDADHMSYLNDAWTMF